eukprot:TRINITY_DN42731_c0_g1_i3.p1 TRINITY_DN42731_c0_g1~~TRINITY_DN42731_c0_g1_i3.p1  ORF type:complete len:737 (+),score=79.99 TRINITY_DN42731_c0_g1_i3:46-2211(+)
MEPPDVVLRDLLASVDSTVYEDIDRLQDFPEYAAYQESLRQRLVNLCKLEAEGSEEDPWQCVEKSTKEYMLQHTGQQKLPDATQRRLDNLLAVLASDDAESRSVAVAEAAARELVCHKLRCLVWGSLEDLFPTKEYNDMKVALLDMTEQCSGHVAAHRSIMQVRCLSRPPPIIPVVIGCLGAVLDGWSREGEWLACRKLLANLNELKERLEAASPLQMSDESLAYFCAAMTDDRLTVQFVARCSSWAADILKWLMQFRLLCYLCQSPDGIKGSKAKKHTRDCQAAFHRMEIPDSADNVQASDPSLIRNQLLLALTLPSCAQACRSRERDAVLRKLPPVLQVEAARTSGLSHTMELPTRCSIAEAKRAARNALAMPPICQQWTSGARIMHDGQVVGELCDVSSISDTVNVTVVMFLDDMWHSLKPTTMDKQPELFREAAEALRDVFEEGVAQKVAEFFLSAEENGVKRLSDKLVKMVQHEQYDSVDLSLRSEIGNVLLDAQPFSERTHLPLLALLEDLAQHGHARSHDAETLIVLCMLKKPRKSWQAAMQALSRLGDGQVIPKVLQHLGDEPARTAHPLGWAAIGASLEILDLLHTPAEESQMPELSLPQQTEPFSDRVAKLTEHCLQRLRDEGAWRKAFKLAKRIRAPDECTRSISRRPCPGIPARTIFVRLAFSQAAGRQGARQIEIAGQCLKTRMNDSLCGIGRLMLTRYRLRLHSIGS